MADHVPSLVVIVDPMPGECASRTIGDGDGMARCCPAHLRPGSRNRSYVRLRTAARLCEGWVTVRPITCDIIDTETRSEVDGTMAAWSTGAAATSCCVSVSIQPQPRLATYSNTGWSWRNASVGC